jgi:hypothetical protein
MARTHDLRHLPATDKGYATSFPGRVVVAGAENAAGYGIGMIPAGHEARQEYAGPMIPGPWAFVYGLAGVIDNHGGTGAEMARETAAGSLFHVEAGDTLILSDDLMVRVDVDARRYPSLTNVEG